MSEDEKNDTSSLVHLRNKSVTKRSSNLVRRGLNTISRLGTRVIEFPYDRSVGTLYTVSKPEEYWVKESWIKFGQASGKVKTSANTKLILSVEEFPVNGFWYDVQHSDEVFKFFLKPYDLQGLDLSGLFSESPFLYTQECLSITSSLVGLEWLSINSAKVLSLSFVSDLVNLIGLDASLTGIFSLAPLEKLKKLRFINLSGTEIESLEYLSELIHLEYLVIPEIPAIWDISFLTHLPNLRVLELDFASYEDCNYEDLWGGLLNDEDLKAIQEELPNCKIISY